MNPCNNANALSVIFKANILLNDICKLSRENKDTNTYLSILKTYEYLFDDYKKESKNCMNMLSKNILDIISEIKDLE